MRSKEGKKKHKKQQKQKNTKRTNKEDLGPGETLKKKNKQKHKNTKKRASQLSVNLFGGCPKFPFFDNLTQKTRTQKTP